MLFVVLFVVLLALAYIYYNNRRESFVPLYAKNPDNGVRLANGDVITGGSMELIQGFRDPYYVNNEKLQCDYYPRANGSIYQINGDLLTGFPFYDRAY
jgi:hypothetical protein